MKHYSVGVPILLVVALVSPLLVVLAPVVLIACLAVGVDPVELVRGLWRVLTALRGTHVEVNDRNRSVLVHIC
jgi:hypothetical protein